MNLNEYQIEARKTAIYPRILTSVIYPTLGLVGEAGEVAEKVKKQIRDGDKGPSDEDIAKELGDVLWYVANLAMDLGYNLEVIARMNLDKLKLRQEKGKLGGSGDNR